MAGDTFDAGTVIAEARLDRDTFKKDLAALRRDMAKFERESRMTIRPEFDGKGIQSGVEVARGWLKSLSEYKVTPTVELDGKRAADDAAAIRTLLRMLGREKATPKVDADVDPAQRKIAAIRKEISDLQRQRRTFLGVDVDTSGIEAASGAIFRFMRNASLAASATVLLSNSFFALSSLMVSLVTAASGLALILPAALMVGVGAAAALKIGMTGVGDALKAAASGDVEKLNEALAKLAPSAREFVLETQRLRPAWDALRMDVQQQLFVGMASAMNTLAGRYLPMLRTELAGIAVELRQTALQTSAWLAGGTQVDTIRTILQGTRLALDGLNPALASILSIFLDLAAVGVEFLPGFATGFADAAASAAAFIKEARASGQLKEWMSQGMSALGELFTLIVNVGSILWSVLKAADQVGGGFLATLVLLTGETRAFLNSAAGQDLLLTFFSTLRSVVEALLPGVRAVGGALAGAFMTLAPHIPLLAQAFSAVAIALAPLITMLANMAATILPPLLHLLIAIAPALGPIAAGLLAMYAAFKTITGVIAIINAIRTAWLILQLAFLISPIGLIITGIVLAIAGLVAGFAYLWTTSEGFRNFWIGLWEGIKSAVAGAWSILQTIWGAITTAIGAVGTAAVWLWQNVFVPVWAGISAATRAVGDAFTWLWTNILEPVFNFIATAAKILLAVLVTIVLAPIILAVKGLGAVFTWLWENAIQPAFQAIGDFVSMIWNSILKPLFDGAVAFIQTTFTAAWTGLGDAIGIVWETIKTIIGEVWNWLKTYVFQPLIDFIMAQLQPAMEGWRIVATAVWQAIQAAIGAAWAFIRDNIWNPLVAFVNGVLIPAFNVARDALVGAWNAIRDGIGAVWNWLRDNIFNPLIAFVRDTVVGAFNTAVGAIKTAWDKVKEIVAAPIRFMVNLVYNEGIVPAWNWIAGIVGLGKLEKVNLGFATGGIVPGYAPGVDRVPAMLSPGEGVVRPEVTKAIGPAWIQQVNLAAMRGGVSGVRRYMTMGGESSGDYKQRFAAGGIAAGQSFARSQAGKPYVWGGVGPGGYDCSGFISAVANVALGQAAHSRRFATGSFSAGRGAGGFVPGTGSAFVIGVSPNTGSGIGHMAGNIGGLNIESSGGKGVSVGGNARGPQDGLFPWQFYLPQVGGSFVPGVGGVDWMAKLIEMWQKVTEFMGRIGEFTGTGWGNAAMEMLKKLVAGAWSWLTGSGNLGAPVPVDQAAGPGAGTSFDRGGVIPTGISVVNNATGRPELAGRVDQWARLIDSARANHGADPNGYARIDPGTLERLTGTMMEVRDLLERRGAGATINIDGSSGDPVQTGRAAALAIRMS